MIARYVVFLIVAAYLALVGKWGMAVLALAGLIPGLLGFVAALALIAALLATGEYVAGTAVGATVAAVFFLSNPQWRGKLAASPVSDGGDASPRPGSAEDDQTMRLFMEYCRTYLSDQCGLSQEQGALLLLDPELGEAMDTAKGTWVWEDIPEVDPDHFLDFVISGKRYDHPAVKRINDVLSQFASEFQEREPTIRAYLQSIGYPGATG